MFESWLCVSHVWHNRYNLWLVTHTQHNASALQYKTTTVTQMLLSLHLDFMSCEMTETVKV